MGNSSVGAVAVGLYGILIGFSLRDVSLDREITLAFSSHDF
jgi:hypothetical protein